MQAFLLDWYKWYQLKNIDELIVQVYRNNLDSFQKELFQNKINGDVEPHGLGRAQALARYKTPAHDGAQSFMVESIETAAGFDFALLGRTVHSNKHPNDDLPLLIQAAALARVGGLGIVQTVGFAAWQTEGRCCCMGCGWAAC